MRVIKQKTSEYEPFHKSLPNLYKEEGGNELRMYNHSSESYYETNCLSKKLKYVSEFERTISNLKSPELILHQFETLLKRQIRFKEIYLFNLKDKKLVPYLKQVSERTKLFMDKALNRENLIDLFSTVEPKAFNDSLIYNIDGSKYFYMLFPVPEENSEGKLLTILIPGDKLLNDSDEVYIIRLCLHIILSKINYLNKQIELNKSLNELQAYQTKLANDCKLSAIGELTSGIVEEILSPLQVILSATEFLRSENELVDKEVLDTINDQVKKVKSAINSLVKFAGNNDSNYKVQTCVINELIREYYGIISSSLKNDNYECILDLEENIPAILSQPDLIQQLFTNVFTMIRKSKNQGGGIFIQTRFKDEKVIVRLLTTDYVDELNLDKLKYNKDISLKIIKNLMAKHEGSLFVESNKLKGTMVILTFPIKRRIGR